jgi:hypothetical protein
VAERSAIRLKTIAEYSLLLGPRSVRAPVHDNRRDAVPGRNAKEDANRKSVIVDCSSRGEGRTRKDVGGEQNLFARPAFAMPAKDRQNSCLGVITIEIQHNMAGDKRLPVRGKIRIIPREVGCWVYQSSDAVRLDLGSGALHKQHKRSYNDRSKNHASAPFQPVRCTELISGTGQGR